MASVPAHSLNEALDHVRNGGRLIVRTYARTTVIDGRAVARFEKAGVTLLREEGDGYRLTVGRGSVYLLPGQLEAID